MTPIQRNTRTLIGVLAELPAGSDCRDLREKFEKVANRKAATFYGCLALAKRNGWIVQDGKIYSLSLTGNWRDAFKPPPIDEKLERLQFEHILTARMEKIEKLESINRRLKSSKQAIAAGNSAAPAIAALVAIMSDSSISVAKRISAAQSLLEYKSPPDIAEAAKVFLATIFEDPEMNVDHRLAATTALRRSEDVRIMPPIERPPPVTRTDDPKPIPLAQLVAERKARADRLDAERLERERAERLAENKPTGGHG